MPKYSMWSEVSDMFIQSANDINFFKCNYSQAQTWMYEMGVKQLEKTTILYILDNQTKNKLYKTCMFYKNRPLYWIKV